VANLGELGNIFKELNTLVVEQGTILDRIDYNIEQAVESTDKAVVHLEKAEMH
jgi:syntaxin 16